MTEKGMKGKGMICEGIQGNGCGFQFSGLGEYRNCEAFITKDGRGGVICPKCGATYVL